MFWGWKIERGKPDARPYHWNARSPEAREFCLGAKRVDGESGSSASTLTSPSVSRYLVHNRKTLSHVAKLLGEPSPERLLRQYPAVFALCFSLCCRFRSAMGASNG